MPRKNKSKSKARRRRGGKRIGAGGLHYPIGRGNMGGGGPYYLHYPQEVPVAATTAKEAVAEPKATDFSSAKFSGMPMMYSFPKKDIPDYGPSAFSGFKTGTPDSSLPARKPEMPQTAGQWPKPKTTAGRMDVIRQQRLRQMEAGPQQWVDVKQPSLPPVSNPVSEYQRPQSTWIKDDVHMSEAPQWINEDVNMEDAPPPDFSAPPSVQTPAQFTLPALPTGPFVFNPPKSKWHFPEPPKPETGYQQGYAPGDTEHKGSGSTLRSGPSEVHPVQIPAKAPEPEFDISQVYEPPVAEAKFEMVNPMRQFEQSEVQTPATAVPMQSQPRTWTRPPPIEIPKPPETFNPSRRVVPPIVPTDEPYSGPQTENSRHFYATGAPVAHIPVVEELGKRKEHPTAGRVWDTKKVKLSGEEPVLGKRKENPIAGRRFDTKKVKLTQEMFLSDEDPVTHIPVVEELGKRKEHPTAGRVWDTKKVKLSGEDLSFDVTPPQVELRGTKRTEHPTSDRRWDTKKVRLTDDVHLGKRKKPENERFLSRKRIKRTELPSAGPPIIPSDSVLALNPFMRSDQRNRVLYPNLPRHLQTGNTERDMTFLGAVNMDQNVFEDFVGYLPQGHPFFQEYNNLFV